MDNDFKIIISCKCGGELYQTAKYNKRYNHRSFKCNNCEKTTTLTMLGITRKIKLLGKGQYILDDTNKENKK